MDHGGFRFGPSAGGGGGGGGGRDRVSGPFSAPSLAVPYGGPDALKQTENVPRITPQSLVDGTDYRNMVNSNDGTSGVIFNSSRGMSW